MRHDAGRKERTHTRLLQATAQSIRAQGLAATTIGGVSAAIGMTHGGFYAHFGSRDELVAAAIQETFSQSLGAARSMAPGWRETLAAHLDFYLRVVGGRI
ncbi:TetR/AcrR family transcriptional regulator [Phenylobacterium sp.]|uniref:TetR/AcrR family transcriptional regulator n=1 Tax=Phenylobacterium sp. TaxID=1871053 RepID=UPI003525A905